MSTLITLFSERAVRLDCEIALTSILSNGRGRGQSDGASHAFQKLETGGHLRCG
jgi:hypothetical protein